MLDNSDGTVDVPLSEISIVRRLDRNGEGGYRLNGARCRLTDVIEVLSDTGLGKETHSVISQGRVEAIVTSKPRDRRLLIEEAAGLGKHRKRRRRAQLKLERTQENLDRALDVEREARTRLRPLKRQAEAAELHERLERQIARGALGAGLRDVLRARQAAACARPRRPSRAARASRAEVEASCEADRRPPRRGRAGAVRAGRAPRRAVRARLRRALGARAPGAARRAGRRRTPSACERRIARVDAELAAPSARSGASDGAGQCEPARSGSRRWRPSWRSSRRVATSSCRRADELEGELGERGWRSAGASSRAARQRASDAEAAGPQALPRRARATGRAARPPASAPSWRPTSSCAATRSVGEASGPAPLSSSCASGRLRAGARGGARRPPRRGASRTSRRRGAARPGRAGGRQRAAGARGRRPSEPGAGARPVAGAWRAVERAPEVVALARRLLADAWVVERLEDLPEGFAASP